jgi:hypothetical protein
VLTLQERLDIAELAGIVELPEVLGLLGKVLPLCERVPLVCDNVGSNCVKLRDEGGEVDVWRSVSIVFVCKWMRPVVLLLHAPMAFWNLFSSSSVSWCTGAASLALSCCASTELLSSVSTPPSIPASV